MCGIAGFAGKGDLSTLRVMQKSLSHRGPDDQGTTIIGNVGLAHTRLAVIDTSNGGHQPMTTRDGRYSIVYNGELYNFKELRKELKNNYSFKTESDTEVILASFSVWGPNCFRRFEGMFALAIHDKKSGELLLARDRFGQKPLFWYQKGSNFVFGSEMKALFLHQEVEKKIDQYSLNGYLLNNFTPAPRTMIEGVRKVEPGHYLVYKAGQVKENSYWRLEFGLSTDSFQDATEKTRNLLKDAVRKRLISDVPLGTFLSGGIDSSLVTALASEIHGKVDTFSIAFPDSNFDESKYAKDLSHFLNTNHHTFSVSAIDMLEIIPKLPQLFDDPVADVSIIPTYILSKETRKQVTVSLGGDGADEIFGGYPTLISETFARPLKYLGLEHFVGASRHLTKLLPESNGYLSMKFKLSKFADGMGVESKFRHYRWLGPFGEEDLSKLLFSNESALYPEVSKYLKNDLVDWGNELLAKYAFSYLLDQTLVKVDRASMANSLEVRSPFLDHKLAEYVFSLPYNYKYRGLTTKRILKEVARPYLPSHIINRKKQGFTVPLSTWLRTDLRNWCQNLLSPDMVNKTGLFKSEAISILVEEHMRGQADHSRKLWNLCSFFMWYNHYISR